MNITNFKKWEVANTFIVQLREFCVYLIVQSRSFRTRPLVENVEKARRVIDVGGGGGDGSQVDPS